MTQEATQNGQRVSWIIQTCIAVLLAVIGVMGRAQFNLLNSQYDSLSLEMKELRINITSLELSLRSDRFSQTDWAQQRIILDQQLNEIRQDIKDLERKHEK